ncbi:MAG: hypothetical protein ABFD00_10575 [Chloroherpetonaceae bacterium]
MPGFDTGSVMYALNVDFTGNSLTSGSATVTQDGQLLIGSTALPNIQVGQITSPLSTVSVGYSSPNITLDVTGGSVVNSVTAGTNINLTGTAAAPIINLDDPVLQTNGSSGAPSYSFAADPTSGMYYTGGSLGLAGPFGLGVEIGFTTQTKNLIEIGAGEALTYTSTSTTPYVVSVADLFISVDASGGAKTVQLPNAPRTGQIWTIKDKTGSAAANNITVTTVGGAVTIDGATTYVLATNYQSINVLFNGTSYEVW